MAGAYTFLPYLRNGLVSRAQAPNGPSGGGRRRLGVRIQPRANDADQGDAVVKEIELVGAGDIVGIDPRMIAATEPAAGTRGFEPNYFPYVDFVDADFPWRYSLAVGDGGDAARVQPWLCLIVLAADEFRHLPRGAGPLPRIEVEEPAASLPDLDDAWAFAHAQVAVPESDGEVSDEQLAECLAGDPAGHFSRLICPRRLEDSTTYHAFLVPTYEAGRRCGAGEVGEAAVWNAPAWRAANTEPVRLPVYRSWRFTTSSLEDFESLVRRLSPNRLGDGAVGGTRSVGIERPGYYTSSDLDGAGLDGAELAGLTVEAEGAIRAVGSRRSPRFIQRTPLIDPMAATLSEVVASDGDPLLAEDGPDAGDPLVALPVYGRHFSEPAAIDPEGGSPAWTHEVNLDLRLRMAAGAGTAVVKQGQEAYMEQCWEQVGEIRAANEMLSRLQLADRLTQRMVDKHLTRLPEGVATLLAEPFFDLVAVRGETVSALRERLGIPAESLSRAQRRIAAKRPMVRLRRVRGEAVRRELSVALPAAGALGAAAKAPAAAAKRSPKGEGAAGAKARTVMTRALAAAGLPEALRSALLWAPTPSRKVEMRAMGALVPAEILGAVNDLLGRAATLKASARISLGEGADGPASLEPVMRAPRIDDPMAGPLERLDKNFLLPNAAELPDETVSLGEENRPFIAAYMAGVNHEMNRELRWREFPCDMKGTVFARFWDGGGARDDIRPIHRWGGSAGSVAQFTGGRGGNLILIVRGELVRRYPELMVGVWRNASGDTSAFSLEEGGAGVEAPLFQGLIDRSTAYFGFNLSARQVQRRIDEYWFALFEPTGRFRFGLDVAGYQVRAERRDLSRAPMFQPLDGGDLAAARRRLPKAAGSRPASLDDLSWSHVGPPPGEREEWSGYIDFGAAIRFTDGSPQWGALRNGASIARATLQKPVCALIKARNLIGNG